MPGWVKALAATVVVLVVLFAGFRLSVAAGPEGPVRLGDPRPFGARAAGVRPGHQPLRRRVGQLPGGGGPGEGHQVPAGRGPRQPHPVRGRGHRGRLCRPRRAEGGRRPGGRGADLRGAAAAARPLGAPALDVDRSYAVSKQRGLLDRLGDLFSDNPNSEQAVQKLAVRHIREAARGERRVDRAGARPTPGTMLAGSCLRSLRASSGVRRRPSPGPDGGRMPGCPAPDSGGVTAVTLTDDLTTRAAHGCTRGRARAARRRDRCPLPRSRAAVAPAGDGVRVRVHGGVRGGAGAADAPAAPPRRRP
ncbi:hypothetical protein STENM223S_09840 [Streptomyces tendae]